MIDRTTAARRSRDRAFKATAARTQCACGRYKFAGAWFCRRCTDRLPGHLRRAMYIRQDGQAGVYDQCLKYLQTNGGRGNGETKTE